MTGRRPAGRITAAEFARRLRRLVPKQSPRAVARAGDRGLALRVLAAATPALAAAVAGELHAPCDLVTAPGAAAGATGRRVRRTLRADYPRARVQHEAYGLVLLAPPPDADAGAWIERGLLHAKEGGLVAAVLGPDALRGAARALFGNPERDGPPLGRVHVYRMPPGGRAAPDAGPLLVLADRSWGTLDADYDAALLEGFGRIAADPSLAFPLGGEAERALIEEPPGYPLRRIPGQSHPLMDRPLSFVRGIAARPPFFAPPGPSEDAALRAADARGLLADPSVRAAMSAAPRLVRTLEEPRIAQLAQLMAVAAVALPAEVGGRETYVQFHSVRRVERNVEDAREGGVRVTDGESLDTRASLLDTDTGEVRTVEDEEMERLQEALAPQLLEKLREMVSTTVSPANAGEVWARFRARMPAALAGQELGREPWGRQHQTVAAGAESLDRTGAWMLVGEMGSGKTSILGTIFWLSGFSRMTVVCPPQVAAEWREQLRAIAPGVRLLTVRRPSELEAVPEPRPGERQVVIVPDSALSQRRRRTAAAATIARRAGGQGYERRAACPRCGAEQRPRRLADRYLASKAVASCSEDSCREPLWQSEAAARSAGGGLAALDRTAAGVRAGREPEPPPGPERTLSVCAGCGWHRLDVEGRPLPPRRARAGRCEACGADCSREGATETRTTDPRSWPLSVRWRRLGFRSDLTVVDEVHRFKGADTQRGVEIGRLMGLSDRVALATATATNGTPSSVYHVLCRLAPALRERFPRPEGFVRAYGVRDHSYEVVQDAAGRLRRRAERSAERPGLHPLLLSEFLPFSSFINQADVVERTTPLSEFLETPALPAHEVEWASPERSPERFEEFMRGPFERARVLGAARAEAWAADRGEDEEWAVRAAREAWDEAEEALRNPGETPVRGVLTGDSPLERYNQATGLVSVARTSPNDHAREALRLFPDTWSWRGEAVWSSNGRPLAVTPPAAAGSSPKEERLAEICLGEAAAGRRCLIFVEGTGVRDVAGRVEELLSRRGLRARVLRAASSGAARRKETIAGWVGEGLDAMISHPGAVGIGMNLHALPTVIAYQTNSSTFVNRQAMARSLRVDQSTPVRHVHMCAAGTLQQRELVLDMSKTLAAATLEGRAIGPDRIARLIGSVDVASQARGLNLMDLLTGARVPDELRRLLDAADERLPAVAAARAWTPPEPVPPEPAPPEAADPDPEADAADGPDAGGAEAETARAESAAKAAAARAEAEAAWPAPDCAPGTQLGLFALAA